MARRMGVKGKVEFGMRSGALPTLFSSSEAFDPLPTLVAWSGSFPLLLKKGIAAGFWAWRSVCLVHIEEDLVRGL